MKPNKKHRHAQRRAAATASRSRYLATRGIVGDFGIRTEIASLTVAQDGDHRVLVVGLDTPGSTLLADLWPTIQETPIKFRGIPQPMRSDTGAYDHAGMYFVALDKTALNKIALGKVTATNPALFHFTIRENTNRGFLDALSTVDLVVVTHAALVTADPDLNPATLPALDDTAVEGIMTPIDYPSVRFLLDTVGAA